MANKLLRFIEDDQVVQYLPFPIGQDILDKQQGVRQYVAYMLDRTSSMFEWSGLPKTIPSYVLELYLQIFGYAAFCRVEDTTPINTPSLVTTEPGVYIFFGGIGGERDIYYRPKMFTAANPRLRGSIQSTILYPGDDVNVPNPTVLMANDRNYTGLLPLFNRYAQQLVENDISVRSAQINGRAQVGIVCSTDRDKESARKYLDDLEAGKLGVLGDFAFLDGIKVSNVSTQSANTIIQLIELQQYLKASWYNELGLNVNFNMKREYMSEEEIAVNTDILLPLVDDMFKCREEAAELINTVFGLNVSVAKSSAWANKEQEELAALAEQSLAGQIPLSEQISDKIGGEIRDTEVQPKVHPESPVATEPTIGNFEQSGNYASLAPDRAEEASDAENIDGKPAVIVNVTIESNTEGGDVNIDSSVQESEALEESEERDPESDPS